MIKNITTVKDLTLDGVTLVKFGATWCQPCKVIDSTLFEITEEDNDILVQKVDIETLPEFTDSWGVRSVPTTIVVRDGIEIDRLIGAKGKEEIKEAIRRAKDAIN